MTTKIYQGKDCDLDALLNDVETWFRGQDYQAQTSKTEGVWFLQASKNETWRKLVGASRAFNVMIQGQSKNFSVELSTGEWASNLAAGGVAAILTGGTTLIFSGITAGWSVKVEGDFWNFIEQKIIFGDKAKSAQELAVIETTSTCENKLQQLKNAYNDGFIDEIAYNAKKLEIEGRMQNSKQDIKTEEKLAKLKAFLDVGILTQGEFEMKKAELIRDSSNSELDAQISKLNAALAAGVLTQEEYNNKKSAIEEKSKLASRIKQLENARDAGIITFEEFEQKSKHCL